MPRRKGKSKAGKQEGQVGHQKIFKYLQGQQEEKQTLL